MSLQAPWVLLLLLLLPLIIWWNHRRSGRAAVKFSSLGVLRKGPMSWRQRLRPLLLLLRLLCLALIIVALARPRKGTVMSMMTTEGIAIEVVIDRSYSMAAEMEYLGQKMNRLEAAQKVLTEFVRGDGKKLKGRNTDLIGLITFGGYAETVCPLLLNHDALVRILSQTKHVTFEQERRGDPAAGTALGDAISLAAARLRKAEEEYLRQQAQLREGGIEEGNTFKIKNKIMVLLTDGRDKSNGMRPKQAIELAKKWGISIYTIGFGSRDDMLYVGNDMFGRPVIEPIGEGLDEQTLRYAADQTNGLYGRAEDVSALRNIVAEIDQKEKTVVQGTQYTQYSEKFSWILFPALVILLLEVLASCTVFRKIP